VNVDADRAQKTCGMYSFLPRSLNLLSLSLSIPLSLSLLSGVGRQGMANVAPLRAGYAERLFPPVRFKLG